MIYPSQGPIEKILTETHIRLLDNLLLDIFKIKETIKETFPKYSIQASIIPNFDQDKDIVAISINGYRKRTFRNLFSRIKPEQILELTLSRDSNITYKVHQDKNQRIRLSVDYNTLKYKNKRKLYESISNIEERIANTT